MIREILLTFRLFYYVLEVCTYCGCHSNISITGYSSLLFHLVFMC